MSNLFQTVLSAIHNKRTREDTVAKIETAQEIREPLRYKEHHQKLSRHKTTGKEAPDKTSEATFLALEIKDK